jgi:hypothetical protein
MKGRLHGDVIFFSLLLDVDLSTGVSYGYIWSKQHILSSDRDNGFGCLLSVASLELLKKTEALLFIPEKSPTVREASEEEFCSCTTFESVPILRSNRILLCR